MTITRHVAQTIDVHGLLNDLEWRIPRAARDQLKMRFEAAYQLCRLIQHRYVREDGITAQGSESVARLYDEVRGIIS